MEKNDKSDIRLGLDPAGMTDDDYRRLWDGMGRLEIKVVEKTGQCRHKVGDTYYYDRMPYRRPEGVCYALLHVMELYTWRTALDFPLVDRRSSGRLPGPLPRPDRHRLGNEKGGVADSTPRYLRFDTPDGYSLVQSPRRAYNPGNQRDVVLVGSGPPLFFSIITD